MNTTLNSIIQENTIVLIRIAGKFTSDPTEKEELVQETFIRSLSSLHKFVNHPKLVSWLYVIMKNVYINKYRKIALNRKVEKEIYDSRFSYPGVKNAAVGKFVLKDIESAMSGLSKENYTIFSMYMEGYSYREIGEYTKIKEGTIKTRIHHIRKHLKKKLHIYQ